ncbi:hypothetical protein GQ600_13079 [Phytophthora cactorum]|nr:hypothetical protein GQ600_13079 [Phytophthora cactorum]
MPPSVPNLVKVESSELKMTLLNTAGKLSMARSLIWNNLLRASDVLKPVLDYPSYAQVQRRARYICWLQWSKNSIQRVKELVQSKAFVADIDPESAFVFGNLEDEDGFPFVGNGEDEHPLILGITTLKLLRSILALQNRETFLIFHLDATFKLSDLGYPVITYGFTDKRRVYNLQDYLS